MATEITIPKNHQNFARELVELARKYNLSELKADWRPPLGDDWRGRVLMTWTASETTAILTSTTEVRCTV